MGNTASNESQQQRDGGGGGSSLNPLSRPRSHGGAPSQPATPGRSSPSWSRHGSLRRGSSQAPSSARASSYFGNLGAVSTDSGLPPPASSSSRRARSRSGSLSTPLASTAQRERAATSTGSPTLSKPSRASSNSSSTGAGPSTLVGRPPTSRRGSAKTPNIDLDDPQSSVDEEPGRRPAPSLSPTLLSPAAFSTHAIISPNPSPSIATDSRHASGTTSYVAPEAAGLSTLEEQTTPTGLTPGGSSAGGGGGGGGGSRAFGKGVAAIFNAPIATFAGSMRSDTTSPTSMDEDTADSSIISSSVATGSEGYSTRGSISGPATAEGSTGGRGATAALPSYLKIPTLIPSKQQQPTLPPTASSTPSSPTGSAPGSGNVTPNSSGWSAVAGAPKASTAALNMEEVILKPGSASRVSSPISEEAPLPEEPTTPMPDERSSEDTDAADPTSRDKGTASLSRTPTPTQKSHAAKALTPARVPKASDPPSWLPTTEEAAAAHRQRVHIATGLASGATTPVMPIPPGLTSAPPSAGMPMVPSSSGGPAGGAHTTLEDNSTAKRLADLSINVPAATAAPSAPLSSGQKTPTGSTANVSGGSALSPISSSSSNAPAAAAGSTTPKSRQPPSHLTPYYYRNARGPISLMPIMLTWRGGGREVFVTGTFANEWRSKILLKKNAPGGGGAAAAATTAAAAPRRAGSGRGEEHSVVLHLPPGTHRMKFIVDDRWRVSRELPTATDGDGNLVNYLEIPNVGPAHPGPLSAPGEDLVDVEAARERERRIKEATAGRRRPGSSKGASESGVASGSGALDVGTAAAVRGGSAGGGGSGTEGASTSSGGTLSSGTRDRSADTRSSSGKGADGDASTSASHLDSEAAHLHQESRRRRAVLDLQEEARRAELVRNGNLEDVFGLDDEALRAAETWVQEVPEGVMRAQQAEEVYRDQCEAQESGGGAEKTSTEEGPQLPLPPSLPRQLEKVILNSSPANPALAPPGGLVDDNSILPAPNHVVLNHLTASAIKGGVLAVGTTTRYKRKYVTTVFYRPVQT